MRHPFLLLLFAVLAGCGEKSPSEGSESTGENPTGSNESAGPSADTAKPPPAETPVAESPSEEPSDTPNSLSDADVERLLKVAVDRDSLQTRNGLYYLLNESQPYGGWVRRVYDSGQVEGLTRLKDGKQVGLMTYWHENGQKSVEVTFKDGELDGRRTYWHKNGQKRAEATYKDGERVSGKWWNRKGEEVETAEDARK